MKQQYRILSMFLALTLIFSAFAGNLAFAEETDSSVISLNEFGSVSSVEKYSRSTYEIEIDKPDVQLEVSSSDESVAKSYLTEEDEGSGYFRLTLEGWEEGETELTFTASDGTTLKKTIAVEDTGYEWDYTAEADVNDDFTIPSGNSRYIKIHYESSNWDTFPYPTLTADNPEDFAVTLIGSDGSDYFYRVDAAGSDGTSATLSVGSSDYLISQELCKVSIQENSNLKLDTKSTYFCNLFDTYRFNVYTDSDTAPDVAAYNDNLEVLLVGKIKGGYEYEMEAEHEGESLVQATLDGETAAFAVSVQFDSQPSVVSDTSDEVSVERGLTYTYKISVMGGGTPSFTPDQDGAFTVRSVRKDGIDYYCTVAATGPVGSSASLLVSFPNSGEDDYTVKAGTVTVAKPSEYALESDTNEDFSLAKGSSYVFCITGATDFYAGSSDVFAISKLGKSGDKTFYRITAVGSVGRAAGFFITAPGRVPLKVCAVTVDPVEITSDTNDDFELPAGKSYQFKITAVGASSIQFHAGSSGVVNPVLVKRQGNDFYYKITATGKPGQKTGIYASVPGEKEAKKLCVVTVGKVKVSSDTNDDFTLSAGQSYQFKITAPGASSINFMAGSKGVIQTDFVAKKGDDFFFRVTGTGTSGQKTGIYVSTSNQNNKKICVISIK